MDFNFSVEEQESHIHFDYAEKRVYITTTKRLLWQKLLKKTEKIDGRIIDTVARSISIPLASVRTPEKILSSKRKPKNGSTV
jgi:hypothetical protein